jgi:hypothetical protein
MSYYYMQILSHPLLPKFGEIDSVYPGSQLLYILIVAIGLQKPYAPSESGTNLVINDVY